MEAPAALHFQGPFTFVDHGRGIASSEFAASEGIYLWVKSDGQRRYIHYVGETTAFLKRHKEHLTQKLGLNYGVFRADAVAADDPAPIYGGMWRDKSEDPLTRTVQAWLRLQKEILASVESVEVFFAPTTLTNEMRKHVEGCLARQLRQRHPVEARFYPADNRTIPRMMVGQTIHVTSEWPIEGLDTVLEV
jgi:hypothetical protein